MSKLISRITVDPEICNGKPIIRGKRIEVQTVIGVLAAGNTIEEVLNQYPSLERGDIRAALEFEKTLNKPIEYEIFCRNLFFAYPE